MTRVVLHADSSAAIGSGHVARAIALGTALREAGASVQLAASEILPGQRRRALEAGLDVVRRAEADRAPDRVVVDGYHLGEAERSALAEPDALRVVIEDLEAPAADAAIVVNGNLYAAPGRWPAPAGAEALLGPAYAMLDPSYAAAMPEREQPSTAERVLVTMGGSDPADATRAVLDALARTLSAERVRVVIGDAHPAAEERARQAAGLGAEVVRAPDGLAQHLAWCDLVVSACGTTVLEAVRLGRPIVGVVVADNQERVARAIVDEGLGRVSGRHPGLDAARLATDVAALRDGSAARAAIARRGPELVDGRGARRVARVILDGPLRLRPARADDADRLLDWRNDPAARAASFQPEPVEPAEHLAWLAGRLEHPEHRIWIGEIGDGAAGVVRLALENRRAAISVAVAPERRGAGIGPRLIAAGVRKLASEGIADDVDAWIRAGNQASVAAFRTAGFREVPHDTTDRRLFRTVLRPMG